MVRFTNSWQAIGTHDETGDARPKIMTMANTLDKIFDSLRLRVDDDYWEVPLAIDTITELIDIRHGTYTYA